MKCFERGIMNVIAALAVMLAVTENVVFAYICVFILMLQAAVLFTIGVSSESKL